MNKYLIYRAHVYSRILTAYYMEVYFGSKRNEVGREIKLAYLRIPGRLILSRTMHSPIFLLIKCPHTEAFMVSVNT
jgi:hypothetical protein